MWGSDARIIACMGSHDGITLTMNGSNSFRFAVMMPSVRKIPIQLLPRA